MVNTTLLLFKVLIKANDRLVLFSKFNHREYKILMDICIDLDKYISLKT